MIESLNCYYGGYVVLLPDYSQMFMSDYLADYIMKKAEVEREKVC